MRVEEIHGRLTAVGKTSIVKGGHTLWKFKCECGNAVITRASWVANGMTSSCGCLRRETSARLAHERRGVSKPSYPKQRKPRAAR
jgi:hypothetical protein